MGLRLSADGFSRRALVLVAALFLGAVAAGSWAMAPEDAEDTAAPEVLADRAWSARFEGAYEEAGDLYAEAARRGGSSTSAVAAAEAYLAARNYARALEMADLAVAQDPGASDGYLLRARALAGLGRTGDAMNALVSHIERGPAGGYGAFLGGELLERRGDSVGARDWYAWALDLGLADMWEIAALRRIGEGLWSEAAPGAAAVWFDRATGTALRWEERGQPIWYDGELVRLASEARPPALFMSAGSAHRASGALDLAAGAYSEITTSYPSAPEAEGALNALAEMGQYYAIGPYYRSRVLLYAGRPEEAALASRRAVARASSGSEAAAALYYAALARQDSGDMAGAIEDLKALARRYPEASMAPDALWQAARLAEDMSGSSVAVQEYLGLATAFPSSQRAAQALLRAAQLMLDAGDRAGAQAAWRRLGSEHPDSRFRAQGFFLLGRSLLGQGDVGAGREAFAQGEQAAPRSYEGLRARDLRENGAGAEPFTRLWVDTLGSAPADDAAACAEWMDTWTEGPAGGSGASWRLERIDRLLGSGLTGPAQAEALKAVARAPTARDLYSLGQALAQRGLYSVSMYAANRVVAASPAGFVDAVPPCLQRLVYPLAYAEVVQREARTYGLDPYLLMALLRQESWFGPRARSGAQALGLSQVTPPTAGDIARALGRRGFAQEDLTRPKESVAFGAWYLGQQYQAFGRRPLLALAAYNAGPGSVQRWIGGNVRMDPDEFVQSIDFSETRTYVRTIYETYARYRELYR